RQSRASHRAHRPYTGESYHPHRGHSIASGVTTGTSSPTGSAVSVPTSIGMTTGISSSGSTGSASNSSRSYGSATGMSSGSAQAPRSRTGRTAHRRAPMTRLAVPAVAFLLFGASSARAADPLDCVPDSAQVVVVADNPRKLAEAVTGLDAFKQAQTLAPVRQL